MSAVATSGRVGVPPGAGEADPICPPSGTRRFFEGLAVEPRRLQIYPGLRHEIFNEPEHERVFEDVLAWVRARSG
jgi:alpha-beta hydrolase superfamily lysophospholipase